MAYEIFVRKTQRIGIPAISFSKIGQIAFNQSASRLLKDGSVKCVLLMWDPEDGMLAIKTTGNEADPRAYHIKYNDKGNGASFSCKTFLDYIGADYSKRQAIPILIDTGKEMIVEVEIPDSLLKKQVKPLPNVSAV